MPAPLPLSELLELLRERKLEIGVREHLTVGRLLSRWDDPDVGSLRDALAAVLARNPEEVEKVRGAFDELYRRPAAEPAPSPPPEEPQKRRSRWLALAVAAVVILGLILGALLWPRPQLPDPRPIASQGPSRQPQGGTPRPLRPSIPDIYPRPDRWRVLTGAAGVASGLLLGLYRVRLRRAAERAARWRWHEELAERPEPQGYEIELGEMAPPFPPAVLEEAASILGRRAPTSPRPGDLDVDATLRRTLRAGLAPQVVFRALSASPSLLVLEDIGSDMTPWKGRISALLAALASRGVPLDRWQFHADAGRVFRAFGEPEISLRQLARTRAVSPLLVISTGEGLLQGWDGRTAPWIEQLAAWPRRAWLHPVGDPGSWRPVLRRENELKISLWPMTSEGLLAIARHLGHGRPGPAARAIGRTAADRPVAPLDVDRLRWLLALSPRQDPELLERLRQEFCPHVPPAALQEALEAPPLTAPLGLPPSAVEVHTFLANLLAASEPEPGTAAHDRWRLDRALQEIRVPGREKRALAELVELAGGTLAGQASDAVEELTARAGGSMARELRRTVLGPIRRRASRSPLGGWRRVPPPDWAASGAALLTALLAALVLPALSPFTRDVPVRQVTRYQLRLVDPGAGPFHFEVSGDPQWRDVPKELVGLETKSFARVPVSLKLTDSARGSWYYVRDAAADKEGVLGISNYEWVVRRGATPAPPSLPVPTEPKPSGPAQGAGGQESSQDRAPLDGERASQLAELEKDLNDYESEFSRLSSEDRKKNRGFSDYLSRLRRSLDTARQARRSGTSDLDALVSEVYNVPLSWEQVELVSGPLLIAEQQTQNRPVASSPVTEQPTQDGRVPPPPPSAPHETATFDFPPDSHHLANIAMAKLDEVALKLKNDPKLVILIIARNGDQESRNTRDLAIDRVKVVSKYLISRHGIDPARIQFTIDPNSTSEGRGAVVVDMFYQDTAAAQ